VSGTTYTAPASMTVSANATAGSGATIAKVDFYAGSTVIGTNTTSPYSMTWSSVAAGSYSLSAVATDSVGSTTRSAAVTVTVNTAPAPPPPTPPPPSPTPSGTLLQLSNLAYEGAFRLPSGMYGSSWFGYGGTALGFNSARGSLYLVGSDVDQLVAEIAIPEIRNSPVMSNLATATVLQPFKDVTEGKMGSLGSQSMKIGGLLPYQGKLFVTGYEYYDADASQTLTHLVSDTNLAVTGDVQGPYKVGGIGASFVSGYLGTVPASWQAALGGPALTGNCCLSIITRTSYGPAVSAFDPTQLGTSSTTPATPLVYYPSDHHTLGDWNVTTQYFGDAQAKGVVFPEGSRSVLFFGWKGMGPWCYDSPTSPCTDPVWPYKGSHAYPYNYFVWAYDANDLAAVKRGEKQPWDVVPYAGWSLTLPFSGDFMQRIEGAAYDPTTNRIFVTQAHGDGDLPLVHVFNVRLQ
jgi:Big-like domain-containing protein